MEVKTYKEGQKWIATLPDWKSFKFEIVEIFKDNEEEIFILKILDWEKAWNFSYIEKFILDTDPSIKMEEEK